MNAKYFVFLSFILILCVYTVYGAELTEKEIEARLIGEYNRGFEYNAGMSAAGGIELNKIFKFRSGVSVKKSEELSDLNIFLSGKYSPFSKVPVSFSLLYIYNNLYEYETSIHSILPFISFNAKRAGVSIGLNSRFTSFFEEQAQFESILSSSIYFNFVNKETLLIGVSLGNFDEFYARNIGSYSLNINTVIRINNNWSIINEFELMQSGGDGLLSTFYGFGWRGGARFTW
jgi:hypothetical protein